MLSEHGFREGVMGYVCPSGSDAAICIYDTHQVLRFTSEAHAALLGRPHQELIGARWSQWMLPADVSVALQSEDQLLRSRQPYDISTRVIRSDGILVPVVVRCSLISGADGDLVFAELRSMDAMEASQSEDALSCATFVRDLTYDLARQSGRYRFRDLTVALLAASASAEQMMDMLGNVAAALRS